VGLSTVLFFGYKRFSRASYFFGAGVISPGAGQNLPKGLQNGSRWTAAALNTGRGIQLQEDHAHNVAQEQ